MILTHDRAGRNQANGYRQPSSWWDALDDMDVLHHPKESDRLCIRTSQESQEGRSKGGVDGCALIDTL